MHMSRNQKMIKKYIQMSCLLMILATPVLYVAGKPVLSYIKAHGKMIIIKGAPDYLDEYGQDALTDVDSSIDTMD